jgi:hypothetical protein
MDFVNRVDRQREHNSPIRLAVKTVASEIRAARDAGLPLNAIHRTLVREGHAVGKGYSSFRQAVAYLDRHGWPDVNDAIAPANTAQPRERFADDRNASDF